MSSQDALAKNGVIRHMNKDHHDSLVRYLQHYHKLSAWSAYDAKLVDVDVKKVTLKAGGKTYVIPLHPPMQSMQDARHRLIDLDKQSRLFLQVSDVTVKEYAPPYGLYFVNFSTCVLALAAFHQRAWFAPGGLVERSLGAQYHGAEVAKFCYWIQPRFFWGLLLIHFGEMLWFQRFKLRWHSVNPRSPQFWLWSATIMIEGIFGQNRFADLVKRKQAAQDKQKH